MTLQIPAHLLPSDGRFGSGPSKLRSQQLARLTAPDSPLGTSHRQQPVKQVVASIREKIGDLFAIPDGYEVLLGTGGASLFWDAITFCLVESRAQAAVFGEFSGKVVKAITRAPWIDGVDIKRSAPGGVALCESAEGIDTYLYAHNETSTGAISPVSRFGGVGALTLVDATSAAGGVDVDVSQTDVYYFSPQKNFGADGGLWLAIASPAALARIQKLTSERWVPDILNLQLAVENSRKDQTLNTPAIATLLLIDEQLTWMLDQGGLSAMAQRTERSSSAVYNWATSRNDATPFVTQPQYRSPVVATVDFDESVNTAKVSKILRSHGVVDIDPYRSLGRNQLRIGTFPNVELADVEALLACLDWIIDHKK
ncbi:MAG: phosphoserine transaminase [Ancrocorticia sp.]|uniref:phosphoserine transaminase n=1 Tax=Ancrocorticia sp. TaxID=2593684 RepID=UPI003F8FF18F